MQLKTKDEKHQLFLSIDKEWNGHGHIFTYATQYEDKASNWVVEFPSMICNKNKNKAMLCLTIEAITNTAESTWDPVKRKATLVP